MVKCDCSRAGANKWVGQNKLLLATMCAVVLGVVLGFSLRPLKLSPDAITWIGIWGELFLRMLKMITLPLIVCCLVVGVASMEGGSSGKLGGVTVAYIIITQLISVILGAILVTTIKPGSGFGDPPPEGFVSQDMSYTDVFTDLFRNFFPENIVQACLQSAYTDVTTLTEITNTSGSGNTTEIITIVKKLEYRDGMNIIGVVVFSLSLGVAISVVGPAARPLYAFFVAFNSVIFTIMNAIIWYSPIGILSLITSALLNVQDLENALQAVGLLIVTVVAGCMIHQLIILPIIYAAVCHKNPYSYFLGILDAYLAGIAPPSSAVAMPYLLKACPDKLGIDPRVAQFVIPIEVTLNRDGSALFIYVVTVFIAQTYSITLGIGQYIVLVLLVTILVMAAAVVPSASIVVLIMVSAAVGIPVDERIGLLMAVEWLTDRVRSGTNIVSHGYGCAVVDKLCRRFIPRLPAAHVQSTTTIDTEVLPEEKSDIQCDDGYSSYM